MNPTTIELVATTLFCLAIIHTFAVARVQKWAYRFPGGSVAHDALHLLSEVEAVFIFWAAALVGAIALLAGCPEATQYLDERDFSEPVFVFVIMTMAATRPVIGTVERVISGLARILPLPAGTAFCVTALIVGPLLGSFVTEPAAMTVTALLLRKRLFRAEVSRILKYAALGTLFVNVSIGGSLTHFAAPPVVMIAAQFGWSTPDMFRMIGWKAAMACVLNAALLALWFRKELAGLESDDADDARRAVPAWVVVAHLLAMGFAVVTAHHTKFCIGGFLLFLGFVTVTKEYQDHLPLRASLLVAGFLGGLVTLGGLQTWWIAPLLAAMGPFTLYAGATILTAVTDNAMLTYLGGQAQLTPVMQYMLVTGSLTGGGLTVLANAPNPAGYAILHPTFGERGISAAGLVIAAIPPTIVAALCFLLLPDLW